MTPDELLQDLRDIHLPEAPHEAWGLGFALEPFAILAGVLVILTVLALRRRRLWRRQARARLREIEREAGPEEQWRGLLELLKQTGRRVRAAPPPDCVFRPLERVGPAEIETVRSYLRATLR